MSVTVLVGNPRQGSRTYQAAHRVAAELTNRQPDHGIDLASLGSCLIEGGFELDHALDTVRSSQLLIVASPTYKGAYTGLLKLFLDRIAADALIGVTAVPVMLGGHWKHALAPEVALKPVLAELGASCPTRGLFLLDAEWDAPAAWDEWLPAARAGLGAVLGALA
jgi:FMN reductase